MPNSSAFEKGIRIVKKASAPKFQLQQDAVDLVSFLCTDLNARLISRTKEEFRSCKRKPPEGMCSRHAQNAVKKLVGQKLKEFAAAEGQKNVLKFQNKMLRYDERPTLEDFRCELAKSEARKALQPKPRGYEFFRGLSALTSRIHQGRQLDSKTKEFLARMLYNLLKMLCNEIGLRARGENEIKETVVQNTVANLLTPELACHAHVEGVKAVMMFSQGMLLIPELVEQPHHRHRRHQHIHDHLLEAKKQREKEERRNDEHMRVALRQAVRQLSTEVRNGCKPNNKACQFIISQLELFGRRLSTAAIGVATRENSKEITTYEMEMAVAEIMPPDMATYAVSEGRRTLTLYTTGKLEIPKERKKSRPGSSRTRKRLRKSQTEEEENHQRKKARKKPTELNFTSCAIALLKEMDISASIDRAGGNLLSQILVDVFHKLANCCKENRKSRVTEVSDVKKSVDSVFPKLMRRHAHTAGNKATGLRDEETDVGESAAGPSGAGSSKDASSKSKSSDDDRPISSKTTKKKWFSFRRKKD